MSEVAKPLTKNEEESLDYTLRKYYGSGFEQTDPLLEAKRAGMKEVLYEDIDVMHREGMRLEGYYVRLIGPQGETTASSATKVNRWINMGFEPVEELE